VIYIDVLWHHLNEDDPIRLVSELNDDRYETRKMEIFSNNRVGFADLLAHSIETRLGEAPVPPLQELNDKSEFSARVITAQEFEELWNSFVGKS